MPEWLLSSFSFELFSLFLSATVVFARSSFLSNKKIQVSLQKSCYFSPDVLLMMYYRLKSLFIKIKSKSHSLEWCLIPGLHQKLSKINTWQKLVANNKILKNISSCDCFLILLKSLTIVVVFSSISLLQLPVICQKPSYGEALKLRLT